LFYIALGVVEGWLRNMSMFLNDSNILSDFTEYSASYYYVDKTMMVEKMLLRIIPGTEFSANKYVCITRPRRFGKSLMISTLGTFFIKGQNTAKLFDKLKISSSPLFTQHLNKHNVIYIDFSTLANLSNCCYDLIQSVSGGIVNDLLEAWPDVKFEDAPYVDKKTMTNEEITKAMQKQLISSLKNVCAQCKEGFIFLFDEWDSPFQEPWMDIKNKLLYLGFLRNLFKGAQYVELAYMTGVLPIPSYSNTSALNMFEEFRLGDDSLYSGFFGFTNEDVRLLHARYSAKMVGKRRRVSLRELKRWYNGYKTDAGNIYNPLSVIRSFTNNKISSYWTASGRATQVMDYVSLNFDNVKDDIKILALEQTPVKLNKLIYNVEGVSEKIEILSILVVVGLLTYHNGYVSIPNKEVIGEYELALQDRRFGYINKLILKSDELLSATLTMDAIKVAEIIEEAHMDESPLLVYSNESELMHVVSSAYISARQKYEISRESKWGKGYCDMLFTPFIKSDTAFVVELKAEAAAESALLQIKSKMYHRKFLNDSSCTGRILLVGIGYDKDEKIHKCVIEEVFRAD
jgi:hypothetical protein